MRNVKERVSALVVVTFAALIIGAAASTAAELPIEPKCEFIASPGSSECMLPFPDDYYTKADPTSPTGRRIDFRELATPTNAGGQHIEVAPYNTGDGFSPGSVITLKIPGIETTSDVAATHAVPINHLVRYKNAKAPVVVIDTSTGQRWPIWVEIDSTVKSEKANLEIHPSVNFTSGDRYIVALRNLSNAKKEHLQAPEGFRHYRDNLPSSEEKVNERRPHFEEIFSTLEGAGIARSSLYLAWDFTVASDENNTARELSMRNAAFSTLGDNNLADGVVEGNSPTFTRWHDAAGRRRQADPERRLAGQLRLHRAGLGDDGCRRIGASLAVRARPLRRRQRGWVGATAKPLASARHRPMRHRRDWHV
jgi:hypothetical protein